MIVTAATLVAGVFTLAVILSKPKNPEALFVAEYRVTRQTDNEVTYYGDDFQGALNGIIPIAGPPLDDFHFEFFGDATGEAYDLTCGEADAGKWFTNYVDDNPDYTLFNTKNQMNVHIRDIDELAHGIL